MDKNWIDLLSLFDQHGVRYLIVGGWAVTFHSQPRFTKDLDLLIDTEQNNAQAVFDALVAFGAPMTDVTVEDLQNAESVYQIGQPPFRIDILTSIEEVDFDSAWRCRVDVEQQGIPVHYLGKQDLIRNKQASSRLQDLADAEAIQNTEEAVSKSSQENTK